MFPYEYKDKWEIINKKQPPPKEDFYSSLNIQHLSDADYKHAKIAQKGLEINNLGDYHNLYVQSDTLLLADVPITLLFEMP